MNHRDQERIHSMKTTIRNSISGLLRKEQLPRTQALRIIGGLPLILLALACFAFMQRAQAAEPDTILPNGNTAEGSGVLVGLTSGVWNSGFGFQALNHDTAGKDNTATGVRALFSNTSGSNNTANGVYALYGNTIGWYNNAVGAYALANNTEGNNNTANGYGALYFNTEGGFNTANGFAALFSNTTGTHNTANGVGALFHNTTGGANVAIGDFALNGNSTGVDNTALGLSAGFNVTTADNVICIGTGGANVSNSCYIGQIFGQPVVLDSATPVLVDSDGKLGTALSSRRFKHDIKPMDKASEIILSLRPVTFHYKSDTKDTRQVGLIAEEVAEVSPDLIVRDKNGEILSVRYDQVNAMLLNEFLKEHRKVQEQDATIAQVKSTAAKQEATIAQQRKDFEALTAGLQKVSDQLAAASPSRGGLEISKFATGRIRRGGPAPQIVLNNQ